MYAMTLKPEKTAFKAEQKNIKQKIGIQFTFILKVKLSTFKLSKVK